MDTEPPDLRLLSILPIGFLLLQPLELSGFIILLIMLLTLSGLVSGSEIAFFSLNPNDLEILRKENTSISKIVLRLKERPRKLLATILISNNAINIAIIILSETIVWGMFSNESFLAWAENIKNILTLSSLSVETLARVINFLIVIVGVTFLLVLFGEVTPKIYASLNNLRFTRIMALPLSLLTKSLNPISNLMVNMSSKIEKKLKAGNSKYANKEDIEEAIDLAVSNDPDSIEEIDILKGILKFSDIPVKQIMRARVDVVAIDYKDKFSGVLKLIKKTGFSRFPIYKDDKDNISGILHVKDILEYLGEEDNFNWQKLIKTDVLYVPEFKMINGLLKEFQLKRSHMAIVVDEYGGSEGIVTLEDVMEEVTGEIKDEIHDFEDIEYKKLDDFNYIFEGKTMLNDVSRILGKDTNTFDKARGNADSIAGLILEITGSIPEEGMDLAFEAMNFKIIKVSKRRIKEVKITLTNHES